MADGIYDKLCPVVEKEEPDWFEDCRRGIATAISSLLPTLEELLGITQPNSQFREGVIDAILFCNLTHRFPPKRRSEIRKELADISDDAAALVKAHQRLMSRLEQTSGIYPPIKSRFLKLGGLTSLYASLSELARKHADALIDRGGQRGLIAFRQLVQSLIPVFERVTGERASVTRNEREGTYQGPFLKLVQKLVLILRDRFPEITYPSSGLAVDISVYKLLQRDRDSGGKKDLKRPRNSPRKLRLSGRGPQRRQNSA